MLPCLNLQDTLCKKQLRARGLSVIFLLVAISVQAFGQTQDENQSTTATGAISGQVVNESGQPIPNAAIFLRASTPLFQQRTASTDNDGKFQINGLPQALYLVGAVAPSFVTPLREPDVPPNYYRLGDTANITLIKGGVITGTVTSAAGDPIVQVAVRAVLIRDANGQAPKNNAYQSMRMTDDRGIYRLYGLLPGTYVVLAGGRGFGGPFSSPYERDAPTYAPSSTRDTAMEAVVRPAEEASGIDIRYRGDRGQLVSGTVAGPYDPSTSGVSLSLIQNSNGVPFASIFTFQAPGQKGFAFDGVADGEYDLSAQLMAAPGEVLVGNPRRIIVKGADVTGIEVSLAPLASLEGKFVLEKSTAPECKNKRQPLFPETLVAVRRNEKSANEPRGYPIFLALQGSPDAAGEFKLRSLRPGQYSLSTQFFARYWYLKAITRPGSPAPAEKAGASTREPRETNVARLGVTLKSGERIGGINVKLAEGAASLRGALQLATGQVVPPKLYVHLVPAEKENVEDPLRFFIARVNSDATFAFNNLAPGSYWVLPRAADASGSLSEATLRLPEEAEARTKLRLAAEAAKTKVELKPCENLTSYQLASTQGTVKN